MHRTALAFSSLENHLKLPSFVSKDYGCKKEGTDNSTRCKHHSTFKTQRVYLQHDSLWLSLMVSSHHLGEYRNIPRSSFLYIFVHCRVPQIRHKMAFTIPTLRYPPSCPNTASSSKSFFRRRIIKSFGEVSISGQRRLNALQCMPHVKLSWCCKEDGTVWTIDEVK
jgi:hypothetical protein